MKLLSNLGALVEGRNSLVMANKPKKISRAAPPRQTRAKGSNDKRSPAGAGKAPAVKPTLADAPPRALQFPTTPEELPGVADALACELTELARTYDEVAGQDLALRGSASLPWLRETAVILRAVVIAQALNDEAGLKDVFDRARRYAEKHRARGRPPFGANDRGHQFHERGTSGPDFLRQIILGVLADDEDGKAGHAWRRGKPAHAAKELVRSMVEALEAFPYEFANVLARLPLDYASPNRHRITEGEVEKILKNSRPGHDAVATAEATVRKILRGLGYKQYGDFFSGTAKAWSKTHKPPR